MQNFFSPFNNNYIYTTAILLLVNSTDTPIHQVYKSILKKNKKKSHNISTMSKINATYSSGYYISPDMDYRAEEDKRSLARKRERRVTMEKERQERRKEMERRKKRLEKGRAESDDDEEEAEAAVDVTSPPPPSGSAVRQTFALPFDTHCGHCHKVTVRGVHVYTNRRATTKKFLGKIRIWSLEIRCRYCRGLFYLETDPETPKETGGYKCATDCYRTAGDFATLNAKNAEVRAEWEKAEREKIETPLEALERENQAAREREARNREVEAMVAQRARESDSDNLALLETLRREAATTNNNNDNSSNSGDHPHSRGGTSTTRSLNQVLRGLGYTGSGSSAHTNDKQNEAVDTEKMVMISAPEGKEGAAVYLTAAEAAAEEEEYLQFEAEMLLQQRREEEECRQRHRGVGSHLSNGDDDEDVNGSVSENQRPDEEVRLIRLAKERLANSGAPLLHPQQHQRQLSGKNAEDVGMLARVYRDSHGASTSSGVAPYKAEGGIGMTMKGNAFLAPLDDDDEDEDDD